MESTPETPQEFGAMVDTVALRHADDERLAAIRAQQRLSLDLSEMQAVRTYFLQEGRDPTPLELQTLACIWSEAAGHKTLQTVIDYHSVKGRTRIDGLARTYITAATERIEKSWLRSTFDSAVPLVALDEMFDLMVDRDDPAEWRFVPRGLYDFAPAVGDLLIFVQPRQADERAMQALFMSARGAQLVHAVVPCHAEGLALAVVRMARGAGARVQLDRLEPQAREHWLSGVPFGFLLAVPPPQQAAFEALCSKHDIEAAWIGELESSGRLIVSNADQVVIRLALDFVSSGAPARHLKAYWKPTPTHDIDFAEPFRFTPWLLKLLAHPQVNRSADGFRILVPSEAQDDSRHAFVVTVEPDAWLRDGDPYTKAWTLVDRLLCRMVASGADPDRVAQILSLDDLTAEPPERLGALVRGLQGFHDAAVAYGAPFAYFTASTGDASEPSAVRLSAVSSVPDAKRALPAGFTRAGNRIYMIGETRVEVGGASYARLFETGPSDSPLPVRNGIDRMRALHRAMQAGLVQGCMDTRAGGLGVALALLCLHGRLGASVDLALVPGSRRIQRQDLILFSETCARFVVEVRPQDTWAFEEAMAGTAVARIGEVTEDGLLTIRARTGGFVVRAALDLLEAAWRGDVRSIPTSEHTPIPKPAP